MLRYPVTYGHNSFAFNSHLNADGSPNDDYLQTAAILEEVVVTPGYRDLRDPYHLTQGGALGRVHKGLLLIRARGRIGAPNESQIATLGDRERALRAAFDPYLCYLDSPTTDGAYALDHYSATVDDVTYAGGIIPLRYYVRPVAHPEVSETLDERDNLPFRVALVAADPRLYEQTEQSVTLTPGAPNLPVTIRGTAPPPWKATITMTGAGSATFAFNYTTDTLASLVLNLSGTVNGDVIVIYGDSSAPYGRGRRITKNGVDAFALKTSGPATWPTPRIGAGSFDIANTTNVGSCVVVWLPARA